MRFIKNRWTVLLLFIRNNFINSIWNEVGLTDEKIQTGRGSVSNTTEKVALYRQLTFLRGVSSFFCFLSERLVFTVPRWISLYSIFMDFNQWKKYFYYLVKYNLIFYYIYHINFL